MRNKILTAPFNWIGCILQPNTCKIASRMRHAVDNQRCVAQYELRKEMSLPFPQNCAQHLDRWMRRRCRCNEPCADAPGIPGQTDSHSGAVPAPQSLRCAGAYDWPEDERGLGPAGSIG